jgi:hypothetical protein
MRPGALQPDWLGSRSRIVARAARPKITKTPTPFHGNCLAVERLGVQAKSMDEIGKRPSAPSLPYAIGCPVGAGGKAGSP